MKHFFWLSAAAYVFLYFYAAWIYDGFSMTLAIALFLLVSGFFYWRHKRKMALQAADTQVSQPEVNATVNTQPISLWRSPLPYIGIAAVIIIFVGTQL